MGSGRPTDVDLALMMGYRWVSTGEFFGGEQPDPEHPSSVTHRQRWPRDSEPHHTGDSCRP